MEVSEERLEEEKTKLDSLESNAKKRVKELDRKKASIRTDTVDIENLKQELIEAGVFDANGHTIKDERLQKGEFGKILSELNRMKDLIHANMNRASEVSSGLHVAHKERSLVQQDRDRLSGKIKSLDDFRHQKLDKLKGRDEDTFKAVTWIQNNKQKFRNTVYEPVALEINVPDKRYLPFTIIFSMAAIVESVLSRNVLMVCFKDLP